MWVKISDDLPDDPRVDDVGAEAFGLVVAALCYSNRMLADGFVPAAKLARLLPGRKPERLIETLAAVGLLTIAERNGVLGYAIAADLVAEQPTRADVERQRADAKARKAAWKERHRNAEGTPVEQRSTSVRNASGTRPPVPDPDPGRSRV